MPRKRQKKEDKCEAGTPLCSGSLIVSYGVNGSDKKNETFRLCGACAVYLKKGGAKLRQVHA